MLDGCWMLDWCWIYNVWLVKKEKKRKRYNLWPRVGRSIYLACWMSVGLVLNVGWFPKFGVEKKVTSDLETVLFVCHRNGTLCVSSKRDSSCVIETVLFVCHLLWESTSNVLDGCWMGVECWIDVGFIMFGLWKKKRTEKKYNLWSRVWPRVWRVVVSLPNVLDITEIPSTVESIKSL